jgi:hypothetical protein
MNGRKIAWVMFLPRIDPPFSGDQRWRDGCMLSALTLPQRMMRQIFPRRSVRDCCYYHGQDFHAIAAVVNAAYRQGHRRGLDSEEAAEFASGLLAGLSGDERRTAQLLLSEECGIHIWRPLGERHWTYQDGRHRARALLDAGVRRILVATSDDHR